MTFEGSDVARRQFEEKIALVKQQKANIPKLREDIAKAKRAGVPVEGESERLDELEAKIDTFLAEYG